MTVDTRRKTAYAVASSIQEILWWSRKHARMCPRVNPDGVPDTELLSRIAKALTDAGWNPFTEAQAVQWAREFPHIARTWSPHTYPPETSLGASPEKC